MKYNKNILRVKCKMNKNIELGKCFLEILGRLIFLE